MISNVPEEMTDGRVTLRRYRYADAAALKESTTASHEHLRGYMSWSAELPTDSSVSEFLKLAVDDFRDGGNANYAITLAADGMYVGSCGLHDRMGPGSLEIGYWVDVRHVRQGVATAAARLLTDTCFEIGLNEVYIRCDVSNEASAAIPRRLGFTLHQTRAKESLAEKETGEEMVWVLRRSTD